MPETNVHLIYAPVLVALISGATVLITKILDRRFKLQDDKLAAQKQVTNNMYPAIAEATQVKIIQMELLEEYAVDRVSIAQFHNGGSFYSNKGMQRMTMNFEEPRRGVVGIKGDVQAVILSGAQLVWLKEVIEQKGVYYPDTSALENGEMRDFYQYYHSVSVCVHPLFDKQARLIGLLTLSSSKPDFLQGSSQVGLRIKAKKLETLLTEK